LDATLRGRDMCGIVGTWERAHGGLDARRERIGAAMDALRHRGPDDHGVWVGQAGTVVLGHRRLSILDVSHAGHQPMVSRGGRYVLTYNGELYNYLELREELEASGTQFLSSSDTEVVLEGFARWGEALLERMVGMFAFAIWDDIEQRMFLARDRAGEKPLYYASADKAFAFASELGALRELPWVDSGIDPDAVAMYLEHQYVPAPLTIYRGARKLPPGHAMTVDRDGLRLWRYWDPLTVALSGPLEIGEEEAVEQLEALLGRAVRQQMISDVPLGAFLSGGIDSTAVVAMMVGASSAPVRTFTIGFEEAEHDESPYARRVADFLGTDHTTEILSASASLERVASIPGLYGEPFGDCSALPTQLVSSMARKHVTVSLSGDGADELFGGYARYRGIEKVNALLKALGPLQGGARGVLRASGGPFARVAGLLDSAVNTDL
jgi:asparagine synthase (glutamine-hydrolysing)